MDRRDTIIRHIGLAGKGLEIGPSFNPVFPKSQGYNVKSLDHLSREGLLAKYRGIMDDSILEKIEEVDFVWSGQPYNELVRGERFDWILAAHLIEHVPDVVAFLNDCASILDERGVLALLVPDRRYSFDYFRPFSSLGAIIDAHIGRKKKPSVGDLIDCRYLTAARYTNETALQRIFSPPELQKKVDADVYHSYENASDYLDSHVWVFTPHSLRLVIEDLFQLGIIQLRELAFSPTRGGVFQIYLSRHGSGPGLPRTEMARKIVQEGSVMGINAARSRLWPMKMLAEIDEKYLQGALRKLYSRMKKHKK